MADSSLSASSRPDEQTALRKRVRELEAKLGEHESVCRQLQQEHDFREALIECAAEGICVCHAIEDHPYVEFTVWNARMEAITGYTMADINQLGWYQTVYPDLEIQERARQRMLKMREGDNLIFERWEITCADGRKRSVGISTSLLSGADGQTHVLAMMQDITVEERQRKQTERRLASLEGILPICASCKQIRDDDGVWHKLEVFLSDHSKAEFSHTVCAQCAQKLYPGLDLRQ